MCRSDSVPAERSGILSTSRSPNHGVNMVLARALARFDTVMNGVWPEQLATLRPGLDDAGIEQLRAAVEPFLLPGQVEELYRWRAGGDPGIFGGWRMRSLEDLISWYGLSTTQLEEPRVWLPVFEDQIINIVTLDVPGQPPSDPSVWYGHTHDAWVSRLFDSIEAVMDVVCDAAEAGLLAAAADGSLRLTETESLDGTGWSDLRQARCPGAYHWPDPPAGTHLSRFPDSDWPAAWRAAVGLADEA